LVLVTQQQVKKYFSKYVIKVTKLIKLSLAMWQSAIFLNEKEKWSQEVGAISTSFWWKWRLSATT
jgi:hypothetical protein